MNQKSNSLATRERIIESATQLFHQHAYQAVGINAICESAGVVKGSFYHFFASKDDLLEAVIEQQSRQVMAAFATASSSADDGRSRVLAFLSQWLDLADQQKAVTGRVLGCGLGVLASELSATKAGTAALLNQHLQNWQSALETSIREGIADGSITPSVDPALSAATLLAVIQGLSTLGRSNNNPQFMRETAQLAVKRLLPVAYS